MSGAMMGWRTTPLPPDWDAIRAAVLRRDGGRCTSVMKDGTRCRDRATDVDHIVNAAAGLAPPPPLFTCPVIHPDTDHECGGPVYPSPYTFAVRCAACGETWDGQMALRRLGLVAS